MKQQIKNWLLQWVIAWIVMLAIWATYAAFTTINSVGSWDTLTASKFNELVTRLNAIDQKQLPSAWVRFDNAWTIADSYNVTSVTKNADGDFTINFTNAMVDTNYSTQVTAWWDSTWSVVWHVFDTSTGIQTTSIRIATNAVNLSGWQNFNPESVNVVIYWWN